MPWSVRNRFIREEAAADPHLSRHMQLLPEDSTATDPAKD